MAQRRSRNRRNEAGSESSPRSRRDTIYRDYDEHYYNDEWNYSGRNTAASGRRAQGTQDRREDWDRNRSREEYGDEYTYQNMDEPNRNDYSGRQRRRSGSSSERKHQNRNRASRQNEQYDEYGSQTGNKRMDEGEYGRSRYGYGNDRNQPMEEFNGPEEMRNKDWNRENSYYRSNRNKNAEYGQEGFGDGPMKSDREKRKLNIYNRDYRELGEDRQSRRERNERNEDNYASRWGRGPEYGISQNAIPGRNRKGGGQDYRDSTDSQHGRSSHFEKMEGHGGHGNLYGHGDVTETEQGQGKGGAQFSGRNANNDWDENNTGRRSQGRNGGSRNARSSRYGSDSNGGRTSRRAYTGELAYDEDFDERDEYLDAYRPAKSYSSDRNNRH